MTTESPAAARARELASAFAASLVQGDFGTMRRLLAPDCRAEWFGVELEGERIVEHAGHEWARLRREFDERRLEPHVESAGADGANRAEIAFTEYLMKVPVLWHRRRWRVRLAFDEAGRIARLAIDESAEDRDAYARYRERCGLETPGTN